MFQTPRISSLVHHCASLRLYIFPVYKANWHVFIMKPSTLQAEVQALLEEVCTKVPKAMRSECKSLVDTYGPVIINYLVLSLSPTEICQKINLCAAAGDIVKILPQPVHVKLLKTTEGNL